MAKEVVAVVGGVNGAQGRSVTDAILADLESPFTVRALTRDPSAPAARMLAAQGAEVVAADWYSVPSLKEAFKGADRLFAMTDFWAPRFNEPEAAAELELTQGMNIAKAAKAAGIKHVVWSGLEDTRKLMASGDTRMPMLYKRFRVPHFDIKAVITEIMATLRLPLTTVYVSFYRRNFINFALLPKKAADGVFEWTFPLGAARLATISVHDIGPCVVEIMKGGEATLGKTVGLVGDKLTIADTGHILSQTFPIREVRYNNPEPNDYRAYGFPAADEFGNMFQTLCDFERELNAARSVPGTKVLNPGVESFSEWALRRQLDIAKAMGLGQPVTA